MSVGVLLLAAGAGRRFGSRVSKQFLRLEGVPLFFHSFRIFLKHSDVGEIIIVVPKKDIKRISSQVKGKSKNKKVLVVEGGRFRGESVANGLKNLSPQAQYVLVHDAARALVTSDIVRRVISSTKIHGVALAAWPLSDTLKLGNKREQVKKTIPRERLWCAQTPQGFKRDIAENCLSRPDPFATDDVSLAEKKGYPVYIVEGSQTNIKVTYPFDLKIARAIKNL